MITQAKKTEERAWLGEVSNIPLYQIRLHWNDINGGDGLAFVPTAINCKDKGQAVSSLVIPAQPELILQQSVADLDIAFKNFFNSCKGKRKGRKVGSPKFKKRTNN